MSGLPDEDVAEIPAIKLAIVDVLNDCDAGMSAKMSAMLSVMVDAYVQVDETHPDVRAQLRIGMRQHAAHIITLADTADGKMNVMAEFLSEYPDKQTHG